MNEQLLLENIRNVLNRLEETLIFAFIERAQFRVNDIIYLENAFTDSIGDNSLVGYLLYETECVHARMRRYTSPDEHPFCDNLPAPILPNLRYNENPLAANEVNYNNKVWELYVNEIVPAICEEGDDQQYGSSSVCDVHSLQNLSRRIHYGKFVAESKYRNDPDKYDQLITQNNREGLEKAITNPEVEEKVLSRLAVKARMHAGEYTEELTPLPFNTERIVEIFRNHVIPLTKEVQIEYLLNRQEAPIS